MDFKNEEISNVLLVTHFDKDEKRIIMQDEFTKTKISQKEKGFSLVYIDTLKELIGVLDSAKEVFILIDLLTESMDKEYKLSLSYKDLMKSYKVSKYQATKIITTLKKYDVIRGSRGKYISNPFIIVPKGLDDIDVARFQYEWRTNANSL